MRTLRFRAWDGRMMLKNVGVHPFISMIHDGYNERVEGYITISPEMRSYKIMQYIGIRDIAGNEIYESDYVSFDNTDIGGDKYEGEVVWNSDQTLGPLGWGLWTKDGYLPTDFLGYVEVLGNIYQNPELKEK